MNINTLNIPLPEDIEKLKWAGEYDKAKEVIDYRISHKDLPQPLVERLLLEKDILDRIDDDFVYTKDDVIRILKEEIYDFKDEEFDELFNDGAFEFIYKKGQMLFPKSFLHQIVNVRIPYKRRSIKPRKQYTYIDDSVKEILENGQIKVKYSVCSKINLEKEKGKKIRVWLPIPVEGHQVSDVQILEIYPKPTLINDNTASHRCVYFETNEDINEFSVKYSFVINPIIVNVDPNFVEENDLNEFLDEQKPFVTFTDYLRDLTKQIIKDETNPYLKAKLIYEYITSHVTYSFMRPYITLPPISEYVSTTFKGDCGVQALMFVTLARIAGIPAKWQSGLYINEQEENGSHDWAMFYIKPYGWLFADCSFGGASNREGLKVCRDFYFGTLDYHRIVQTKDVGSELIPEKKFTRKDPYDNQTGEVEYEDRGLNKHEFKFSSKVIDKEYLQ